MHFCNKCENMYYIKISENDENKLLYYCRRCGNEDSTLNETNVCVSKVNNIKNVKKTNNIINKYTKYDVTLPRVNNTVCPNKKCIANQKNEQKQDEETDKDIKDVKNEILYIRYDDNNMKYIYMCVNCDHTWKS